MTDLDYLKNIIAERKNTTFDPECVLKNLNAINSTNEHKLDFLPDPLLNDVKQVLPNLFELIKKIRGLEKKDTQTHGKPFKHFVFFDANSNPKCARLRILRMRHDLPPLIVNTGNEETKDGITDVSKSQKSSDRIIKSNIRELITEAKQNMQAIKENIKDIREQMKNRNLFKRDGISHAEINMTTDRINQLQHALKNKMEINKTCIQKIKKLLKTNLTDIERGVVKMILKDEHKTLRAVVKINKKKTDKAVRPGKKTINRTFKKRTSE